MFAGRIDDLPIFDLSLTVSEVSQLVGIPTLGADLDFDGVIGPDNWAIFITNHLSELFGIQPR